MEHLKFVSFPLTVWILLSLSPAKAQEYKYEAGPSVGTAFYMGDANKTRLFLHPGIEVGALLRYNINFHWAVKTNILAATVAGNTTDAHNPFPMGRQTTFRRRFIEAGGQMEYHFFPYSDKYAYRLTRPYTPYVFAGLGVTVGGAENPFFGANLPVGIGFKYKIKQRLNIGVEFSVRKLFADDFDVTDKQNDWNLNAPYGIKSSFLKNQDWYWVAMIFLTWDFGPRYDPCCGE